MADLAFFNSLVFLALINRLDWQTSVGPLEQDGSVIAVHTSVGLSVRIVDAVKHVFVIFAETSIHKVPVLTKLTGIGILVVSLASLN